MTTGSSERFAATVGTFDGVHLGHLKVLDTLRQAAEERSLTPVAITFDAHPLSVIAPERMPRSIMSTSNKIRRLRTEGFSTHIIDFNPEKARMSAREWIRNLHEVHHIECIVIGYDNTFGHDGRSLTPQDYRQIGAEIDIDVIIAPELEGVSSSAIRHLLAEGKIEEANRMLGFPFILDGIVEEGDKIGRTLGFPTANLQLESHDNRLLPPFGVYASNVIMDDGKIFPGVTNIGIRPSVKDLVRTESPRIETHIIGYSDDNLYGKPMQVGLLSLMRKEQKFDSLDALRKQLSKDVELRKNMKSRSIRTL